MEKSNLVENEFVVETGSLWGSVDSIGVPNQMGNTSRPKRALNTTDSNEEGPEPSNSDEIFNSDNGDQEMTPTSSNSSERETESHILNSNSCPIVHSRCMKEQWEVNYKESAIFLEEGINNDKFTHHPRSREELPAYLMVHNYWFHAIDLGASLILLALGFVEQPCYSPICVPTQIHSSIEICVLILVAIQVILKTRWIGWKTFIKHKRTMIKVTTLLIMFIEALVILVRSNSHFRVSRALRPIFLIDNHFCGGVRRFIRQILQSLPPIMDMLGLVCFVTLIFSVFGFYLFGQIDEGNFGSLKQSFISLFILLTTANYPDVMMSSYNASRWSAIFFICYLSINLYFLMNLMLAVVYDAFTRIEKDKFRRLFLHKRKAAQHAFNLLVTKERSKEISFVHFEGFLKEFKTNLSPTEAYLIFKYLNKSGSGYLDIEEFYEIYDACLFNWSVLKPEMEWFHDLKGPFKKVLSYIRKIVMSYWFEVAICSIVMANGVILLCQTWIMSEPSPLAAKNIYAPWITYFFVGIYTLEATLKLLGLGIGNYFASYWNIFDFGVTSLGIISLILQVLDIPLFYVVILRPLRLLTLFRMKKRFRDVFGTAVILFPRLTSAVIVLLLIYYFFGTIGMECFHSFDLFNCCKNTSVEQYYKYEEGSGSNSYFYLNNFKSLTSAGVTLFELTVVNNWYVIMEGFAIVTDTDWSRIFFMAFYIFTMIVITIIVAFILEAFLFRIQYKQCMSKDDELKKLTAEIHLTTNEINRIVSRSGRDTSNLDLPSNSTFTFIGNKSRTKEQLQILMYTDEMDQWIAEARLEEAKNQARIQAALLNIMTNNPNNDNESHISEADDVLQVVEDEDNGDVTTIQRSVLPDII